MRVTWPDFRVNFLIIKLAKNTSSKLNGMAIGKIPKGRIPKFPKTNHINTNPTNQDKNVVLANENFWAIKYIAMAKHKDQTPQIAPLTGCSGKIIPSFS